MNPQKLAAYQKRLLALRAGLQNQISDQRGGPLSQAEAAAERFGKPEDPRAQMNTERDLAFALSDREAEEIVAIDAALNHSASPAGRQPASDALRTLPRKIRATPPFVSSELPRSEVTRRLFFTRFRTSGQGLADGQRPVMALGLQLMADTRWPGQR